MLGQDPDTPLLGQTLTLDCEEVGAGSWEGLGRPGCVFRSGTVFANHYIHPGANLLMRAQVMREADRAEACGKLWTVGSLAAEGSAVLGSFPNSW